jgi:hypothetical protein
MIVFYIWLAGVIICFTSLIYLLILDCVRLKIRDITWKDVGIIITSSILSWIGCVVVFVIIREIIELRKEEKRKNGQL